MYTVISSTYSSESFRCGYSANKYRNVKFISASDADYRISDQEKEKIGTRQSHFYGIKMKYEARRLKDKIKREVKRGKEFINELFNDP
jgi:hypothetical protein